MITIERSALGTDAGIAQGSTRRDQGRTSPLTRGVLRGRVALDRLISLAEPSPAHACRQSATLRRGNDDRLTAMPT